ncbi:uncharacterized protein METZ01_LOCUS490180, partial [marine metagenome]
MVRLDVDLFDQIFQELSGLDDGSFITGLAG